MASIDAVQTSSSQSVVNSQSNNTLSQMDFFKLLTAQLKNQDPTKPLDATAFTAQLAQFSSLQQLQNVNATLTTLQGQQALFNQMGSAQLVGKAVTANGNQAGSFTATGKPVNLGYNLPAAAKQVSITIYDAQGRAVDTIQMSDQSAGVNTAVWQNSSARTGNFTFQVAAFDGKGGNLNATTLVQGVVSAVNFHDGKVYVTVNNKEVGVDQILSVTDVKS